MATRAVWKGSINFGLVSISIELYTAIQPHVIGFKLLHAECNTPIANKRWCPHCNREISWEEIVKGLKLPDGSYFVITPENLKKLRAQKTDTIDIVEFVDLDAVSALYYDQHYYIAPQKGTQKAFFLFTKALAKMGWGAIGQFVLRDKEYRCVMQPYKNTLLLTTLNYDYEIKQIPEIEELVAPGKVPEQELRLAQMLMDKLYKKSFDMSEFKDSFAEKLAAAIKAQQKGKIREIEEKKKPVTKEKESLMEALRASLESHEKAAKKSTRLKKVTSRVTEAPRASKRAR